MIKYLSLTQSGADGEDGCARSGLCPCEEEASLVLTNKCWIAELQAGLCIQSGPSSISTWTLPFGKMCHPEKDTHSVSSRGEWRPGLCDIANGNFSPIW